MTINYKKNFQDVQMPNRCSVNEPAVEYQRRNTNFGVTRMITQKELDAECFSLEESKNKLIEKIHRHFHHL